MLFGAMRKQAYPKMICCQNCKHNLVLLLYFLVYIMIEKTKRYVSPGKMLKQAQKTKGYLFKKSNGFLGGWNQRYFIIFNGGINYYDDQSLQKHRGEIKLKDVKSVIIKDPNLFSLQTKKKQYSFKCQSKQVRDLWIASLNLLKQYVSNDDLDKRLVIKKDQNQLKAERFQLCGINEVKNVLIMMNLNLLAKELDQSRIHQRIFCQKVNESYYLSVSIKCLQFAEVDEEILQEKYIIPFSFNRIYKINKDGKVQDIGRMSQMQSLKTLEDCIAITFSDKKKILLPFKNQLQIDEISTKLCRCYQVGKQYYNPFKIVLKKNVDRLLYLYENFRDTFDQQLKQRIKEHFQKYFKSLNVSPVQTFLSEFRLIKKDLIQTEQACKVLSPPKDNVKFDYFKAVHQEVRVHLPKIWQNLFAKFEQKNIISFSSELYEYWIIVNPVVADSTLLQGCFDLNTFFMGRASESLKQKIQEFNNKKIQYKKIKNDPIANELTYAVYEWLKEVNNCLSQIVSLEVIINQYCKFYAKCCDQFLQYLWDISDKWNDISVIIGACNDLSRIKSYLKTHICPQLCKGIIPEKKFYSMCGNQILKKLNQCMGNLIKRAFIIVFKTIDRKLLAKSFIEIDFSKICYEVLQRLQPFKSKLFDDVEYEMVILSFDEICFFFFTTFINKNIPIKNKTIKEYYIKAVEKGLTSIQQYYCNIKTQNYVKNYLKEISNLKEILICPESSIPKYCSQLHQTFGSSFNEQTFTIILKIRQISQQSFKKLIQLCSSSLKKSPSSQDSQSCQDCPVRSRKSTLNEQPYSITVPEINYNEKIVKQGYLQVQQIVKGIPNFFSKAYFRIRNKKMLEYYSASSSQLLTSIQLEHIDYCFLDSQGTEKCVFIITVQSTTYYFKAATRDQAGLWVQAIFSEIKSPLFENKSQCLIKECKNTLFKNLQAELTTTCSNQRNTHSIADLQKIEQKLARGDGTQQNQVINSKQIGSSTKQKSSANKQKTQIEDKRRLVQKQDEGICCSKKLFWI